MFLSSILNIIILGIANGMLADPYMFAKSNTVTIRDQMQVQFAPNGFTCRLDQTGDSLIALIFTDFIVTAILQIGSHLILKVNSFVCKQEWVKAEFDTASSMVSVLYSTGLFVLALPFAPICMIFAPIMLALKFKWEAFVAFKFSSKPNRPWQAHAAGRTFTLFYLITIFSIGVSATFYFLGNNNFAKLCDIQDLHVGLCASPVVDDVCSDLNANSPYYLYFNDAFNCPSLDGVVQYPSCVCHGDWACGPFIDEKAALFPFQRYIQHIPFFGFIWVNFVQHSYGSWIIIIFLGILAKLRYNSFRVIKNAKFEKEQQYLTHIASLQIEQKRQLKIIHRLKLLEGASAVDESANNV